MNEIRFRIAHISDTHISPHGKFVEDTFDWAVHDINKLEPQPDVVIHSGDLTSNGVLTEYELAIKKLEMFNIKPLVAAGNHDVYNYGYSLFKEMVGPVDRELKIQDVAVFIWDSPQPDRNEGRLGRRRQMHLEERLGQIGGNAIKILVFHHLVPVPFSKRSGCA